MIPCWRLLLPALLLVATPLAVTLLAVTGATAQPLPASLRAQDDVAETRRALAQATRDHETARLRAERLEAEAARVTAAADRTARQAAAVAARIQQTEARIAGQEAQIRLIARDRRLLAARLAERQRPLVRLTAALQRLSRRPPALALLRPGSVRDTMYLRALLETLLPEVERRTAALKVEIGRAQALQRRSLAAARQLRADQATLRRQRQSLAMLETQQRLASREANSIASREADRALALAEQARDLGGLVAELGRAGQLREQLSRLPGPVMRPARPGDARVQTADAFAPLMPRALPAYALPVSGRLVTGFGDGGEGQPRSRGIALATRPGAQTVAPAPGRVAFAGPYRGYGQIVIIEHGGGWTTLVTGLAELDARVGDVLVAGAPLGVAGAGRPVVNVELRRDGVPVNPLELVTRP